MKKVLVSAICILIAAVIAIIIMCCLLPSAPSDTNDGNGLKSHKQSISYTESTAQINNPDQGFYRPIYVKATEEGITYNKSIVTDSTRLYHLRIDISEFSSVQNGEEDRLLTSEVLDGLDGLLSYLKEKDKNAIVRFAYDPGYGGAKDKEPDGQIILRHVEQVCPVINNYQTTVTAIEAGLIGPWGEMHSSAIANAEHINPIIEAYLTNTDSLPVLVRTPKMIYDYLGITLNDVDGYAISESDKAYRLGIFNDGYLGSGNDLGTYTDRAREIEFLSKQTDHLPYGGEVVAPSSTLHDIENCLPEMFGMNLSYLNVEWNDSVIAKWKATFYTEECGDEELYYGLSAFEYIRNRMGYRYVVTGSVFRYGATLDKLEINLTVKNVGFGNLNNPKKAKLIFVDGGGEAKFTKPVEDFTGQGELSYSTDLNLDSGRYEVYLCLYGEEAEGTPLYALQFANEDMWNAGLKANKIGEIEI